MAGCSFRPFYPITGIIFLLLATLIVVHAAPQVRRNLSVLSDADIVALRLLPFYYSQSSPFSVSTSSQDDVDYDADSGVEQLTPLPTRRPFNQHDGSLEQREQVITNEEAERTAGLRGASRKRALSLFAHWREPPSAVSRAANPNAGTHVARKASPWLRWG